MAFSHAIGRRIARAAAAAAIAASLAVPALAHAPVAEAGTRLCAATPFRADSAAHVFYRIPALVATTEGTLLAFAERRTSEAASSDTGDTSIVLARSTDRGCTWSAPSVVADHGTDTVGNPAPVVDTTTGRILLFSVDRPQGGTSLHGLHLQASTDDGRTFTPYADASRDLDGLAGWSGGLIGPGHAIQIRSGVYAGRIVVPIGYERNGKKGAYGIVSDDHGASWRIGYNALGGDTRLEGSIAALPDGRLWIAYREQSATTPIGRARIAGFSTDGGGSLQDGLAAGRAPHTIAVEGSSLALSGTHGGILLFSSPIDTDVGVRRDLGVFVSRGSTVGTAWSAPYAVRLEDTPASYSDLVQIDDDTIGVLFETGTRSWHEGVSFRSMSVAALLTRRKAVGSVAATVPSADLPAHGELHVHLRATVPGTTAPAGTFRVRLSRSGWSRTLTLPLVATNSGARVAVFSSLPPGRYTLHVQYVGTSNIRGAAAKDRIITVR